MSDSESDAGDLSSKRSGDNSQIEVYGRIRPSKLNDRSASVLSDDRRSIEFRLPRDQAAGSVNNKKELYEFKMQRIFDEQSTQHDVFEGIGRKVVDNVMQGFNGTIFAYGQTGSGKTFTMTGGADRYEDRGLIPRTLSLIFEQAAARSATHSFSISISYLEIYNDDGFDLLDADHDRKSLAELPKVSMFEDDSGQVHMRNIHLLPAASVDEALNLLFVGDTNRVICATSSNDQSTRSHCIFSIYVTGTEIGSSLIRRSKLHLVDLAGSERVKKTAVAGKILNEALHINLALHYLEQVIVALHKRTKDKNVHIPYRNSMMTSVLRDSLGGNCKTVMIATLSGQRAHIDESISTCRFAARVAMVRNAAVLNEELDPHLLVRKLKMQVRELKEEIAALRGEQTVDRALDADELERCRQIVAEYVSTATPSPMDSGMPNPRKVEACFAAFKSMLLAVQNGEQGVPAVAGSPQAIQAAAGGAVDPSKGTRRLHPGVAGSGGVVAVANSNPADQEELKKLRLLVAARDNEISQLVALLRQNVAPGREAELLQGVRDRAEAKARTDTGLDVTIHAAGALQQSLLHSKGVEQLNALHARTSPEVRGASEAEDAAALAARLRSFEEFRRSYRKNQLIEEQKDALKAKIDAAQKLGESINRERNNINAAKASIEQRRLARGVASLQAGEEDPSAAAASPDAEETSLLSSIDASKAAYRTAFAGLKDLKAEIEHLKALIERSRRKLQADFEVWWAEQQKAGGTHPPATPAPATPSQSLLSARLQQSDFSNSGSSSSNGNHSLISGSLAAVNQQPVSVRSSSGSRALSSASSSLSSAASSVASYPSASPLPSSSPSSASSAGHLPSTGNAQADADIARFYEMRDALMKQQQRR